MSPVKRTMNEVEMTNDVQDPKTVKIIRMPGVLKKTLLSKSTISDYRKRGKFVVAVKLGIKAIGFVEQEVDQWILDRVNARGVK